MTKKKVSIDLKKGRLSNVDFETFKENIYLNDEELGKLLKRTSSFIAKTRQRVYPNKKSGRWNKTDLEILKERMCSMPSDQLARLLNRTEKSITSKLKSLLPKEDIGEIKFDEETGEVKINDKKHVPLKKEIYMGTYPESPDVDEETEESVKVETKLSWWKRFFNFFK